MVLNNSVVQGLNVCHGNLVVVKYHAYVLYSSYVCCKCPSFGCEGVCSFPYDT